MYDWLTDAIAGGAEVVTASRRLARELQTVYERRQLSSGARAWLTPAITFWGDWLERQFAAAAMSQPLPLLLSHNASALLWEQCLRRHVDDELLNFASLVMQAQSSWLRLHDWRVPLEKLGDYPRSDDQQRFVRAAGSYRRLLDRRGWIDEAGLAGQVAELFRHDVLAAPGALVYSGFDRLSPAIENVFAALDERGCATRAAACRTDGTDVRVLSFFDLNAELRTAGSWARQRLAANPEARIAIIRTGLDANADQAARLLREGLVCGWQYGGHAYRNAVNVSYGRRLADYPAVAIACLCLKWLHAGLTSREISLLLRSRLIGSHETAGRSRLELRLRRFPDRNWTPASLLAALRGLDESADASAWLDAVGQLVAMRRDMPRSASPANWAEQFDAVLEKLGWPGEGTPDSEEFQLLNRWRSLLNELAALDLVLPQLSLAEAVQRLNGMAADSIFQPQSPGGLIDLLGALEAAGMEFDAVWITGLDSGRWPPAGNPSLLLPRTLQREVQMPDATPDDTRDFAKRLFDRLSASAGELVLSWATSEQGAELARSPLLHECRVEASAVADPGWHAASLQRTQCIVDIGPDPAPPIGADEIVSGGAYTVTRFLSEPFSAFAYGRLRINELAAFEIGLPANLRGSIVHDALHALYGGLPTLGDLRAWRPDELQERIAAAAGAAVRRRLAHTDTRQQRLLELEQARLRRLLASLIEVERTRPEFATISVERRIDFERDGVRLQLRADRIDRLADRALLVIDYKTGAAKSLLNRDGVPADPQLVVYSLALEERVGALALINIDSRAIKYSGAGGHFEKNAAAADAFPGRLAAWQAQVVDALQRLAAGDSRIDILQNSASGRPLNILSRLEESRREF